MQLEEIAKALVFSGYFSKYAIPGGFPSDPIVGDLVFEVTSMHTPPYIDKVGTLIDANTIKTLDGREIRWENHVFRRIPTNITYPQNSNQFTLNKT